MSEQRDNIYYLCRCIRRLQKSNDDMRGCIGVLVAAMVVLTVLNAILFANVYTLLGVL